MPRRNQRAAGRGKPKAYRSDFVGIPSRGARRPVEAMKLAPIAGRCPGPRQRLRYETAADAAEALKTIRASRLAKGHPESSIEKRFYECPIAACGGWHLTSRVSYGDRA
jgi:hypothetical protein